MSPTSTISVVTATHVHHGISLSAVMSEFLSRVSRKELTKGIYESIRLPRRKTMFAISNRDKVLSLSKYSRNLANDEI